MNAAPAPAPPSPPGQSAWPRSAQLAAALLLGAALALLAVHAWGTLRWGSRPTELDAGQAPAYRIDLNRADRAELLQIPGIGPRLAERIETYRHENGGFQSVDDLRHVPGVGPATIARLRPWVCVAREDTAVTFRSSDGASREVVPASGVKKADAPTEPLDLNTATAADLRRLPGIGPKLSQAIVDEREKGAFKSVDDLHGRVKGIGGKTLERLRPYLRVGSVGEPVAVRE